eukprot:Ihof_evm1s245 gene=Ihof_evmTU1s245
MDLVTIFITLVIVVGLGHFLLTSRWQKEEAAKLAAAEAEKEERKEKEEKEKKEKEKLQNAKQQKKAAPIPKQEGKGKKKHQWEKATLKGHTDEVMSIDINKDRTYCLTSSADGTLRVWPYTSVEDKSNRHVRSTVDFDSPTTATFSNDGMYVLAAMKDSKDINIYKFTKDKETKNHVLVLAKTIPAYHTTPIHSVMLSPNNKYIMACSIDTTLSLWDIKGERLDSLETGLMLNWNATISPDSRFIMVTGFVSEAKVYAVDYSKTGEFKRIATAFQLGHKAGVYDGCFSDDTKLAVTVSKDGTWKLWDIDIRYEAGQEADCITTGTYPAISDHLPSFIHQHTHIAISPDSTTVVVAVGTDLYFYAAKSGLLDMAITNAHPERITSVEFDPTSEDVLTTSKDKVVKVWMNITGMKVRVDQMALRLKTETSDLVK